MTDDEKLSDPVEARKKAMDYLARREYGRTELVRKLLAAGYTTEAVDGAIARLAAEGLQSDARFVEAFVQSRVNQGKGPERIRAELRDKRLDDGAIEQGLAEAGVDWRRLAAEVRAKKFGRRLPADFAGRARQMRFLQYRGFEAEQIQAVVSEAVE